MLEEIEFHRLAKLRLEVDEPEELLAPTMHLFISISNIDIVPGILTVVSLLMTSLTIVSPPKPKNPSSWWIA